MNTGLYPNIHLSYLRWARAHGHVLRNQLKWGWPDCGCIVGAEVLELIDVREDGAAKRSCAIHSKISSMNHTPTPTSDLLYSDIKTLLLSAHMSQANANRATVEKMQQMYTALLTFTLFIEQGQWPVRARDLMDINKLDALLTVAAQEFGGAGEAVSVDVRNCLEKIKGYNVLTPGAQTEKIQSNYRLIMSYAFSLNNAVA